MKTNPIFLIDLDHTLYDVVNEKLYDDAISFIKFANKNGKAVLFTEGELKFQGEKIKKLNLNKYFGKNIKIFKSYSKISEIGDDFGKNKVFLIDDNPNVLIKAKDKGWKTIRVRRGKYENMNINTDYIVSNLKDIENLSIFYNV